MTEPEQSCEILFWQILQWGDLRLVLLLQSPKTPSLVMQLRKRFKLEERLDEHTPNHAGLQNPIARRFQTWIESWMHSTPCIF